MYNTTYWVAFATKKGINFTSVFPGLVSASSPFSSVRATIPFSTKYPELIIPEERVCLPRIRCAKTDRRLRPPAARNTDR